jgi:hypothetical protein
MKTTLTKVVKVGVRQSQGTASRALGGPPGQGHEGHMSTSEGCIQLHGLGGFGVLGLKNTGRVVFGLGLKTQERTWGGTWDHRRA